MKVKHLFPPTIDGTVYLEVTHRCNYKCQHCYAACPKPKEITFGQIKRLAKVLKRDGFKKVILTGGEPLLVSHIKQSIDLLSKDFKVLLVTNGTLIRKVHLNYKKLAGVYISYDGPTEKEYRQLRGRKGLTQVKDNIKWLMKQNIDVAIGIILSKYNINKVDQLIKQAKDMKIKKINLTLVQPFGRALQNQHLILKPEEYLKVLPKLSKVEGIHFESMLCYPKELKNNSEEVNSLTLFDKYISGCAAGKKFIYINPDGFVTPCGYITADEELLKLTGNIFKQDLKTIYKTPLFKFFMNRSWESLTGKCKLCDYSIICKGGCPFRSHYLRGNPVLPDPWCLNQPKEKKYLDYQINIKNFEKEEVLC